MRFSHSNCYRFPQLLKPLKIGQIWVAIATLTGTQMLPMAQAVMAQAVIPGLIIENKATGSYVDPVDNSSYLLESNIVRVTVTEVAGITVTPAGVFEAPTTVASPGPSQGDGSINADDVVYFVFKVTNVGNDPTQFFIPGSPSSLVGGTQVGPLEIIKVDPDGPNGATAETDFSTLPITIRPEGNNTGDATALGMPVGVLQVDGTVTLRIPVKLDSGLNPGDSATVILGDTGPNDNSPLTQNQPYVVSPESNPPAGGWDLYTQDNQDTDGIEGEGNGAPSNGDVTFHRQEASGFNSVTISQPGLNTDYGDAPDTDLGFGPGNYQTLATDSGAAHTLDPDLYIGTAPDGDNGTQQNINADADDTSIASDEGAINLPTIADDATAYLLSDLDVTNNSGTTAHLVAWIDFNQDGEFTAAEASTVVVPSTGTQTVSLNWSSLPGLIGGQTYARFRLTTDPTIATGNVNTSVSTGLASDGEVEDYAVSVAMSYSLSGTLFQDTDGNDIYGVGIENTLPANITVRLLNKDSSAEIAETTTDINGFYQFSSIVPGSYRVVLDSSDPDIPLFLKPGTPESLLFTIESSNITDLNFGFDRRTFGNGGFLPACDNPYGEVYSVTGPNVISAVHGDTGNVYNLTTSTFSTVTATNPINGAATDHINRLVYYGSGNNLFAWDAINDQHFTITADFQQELTNVGYTGDFVTLSSGGAAFYNGSLYIGVDGLNAGLFSGAYDQDFEIFRVDFTPDGRTINGITPLGMSAQSANELRSDNEDWGDFTISDSGVILAISTRIGVSRRIWNYDLNTSTFTLLGNTPDNFQLAKDGDGRLWGLASVDSGGTFTSSTIQELNVSGTFSGPVRNILPHVSFDAAECAQGLSTIGDRVWNDLDGDGIQESGELGIPNVTVGLYRDTNNNGFDPSDLLLDTQLTDANGNYDFTDLLFGSYVVRILEGTAEDQDTTNVLLDATLTTSGTTPGGLYAVNLPVGIIDHNDADFGYQLDQSQPRVLLVKRITGINGQSINPHDGTVLDAYINGTGAEDNHPNWPSTTGPNPDLWGAITGGVIEPDDEIEYTIYFLSAGTEPAANVVFCDRIPDGQTFILDSFNAGTPAPDGIADEDRGIEVSTANATLAYTNIGGDDTGRFYPPTSGLPPACNTLIPNTENNGAVVIELGTLPNSTGAGIPNDSTGYIRFRTKTQ